MIDDSCEVPREDLDDGFNPCRRQVVENGELCQYAHMYDVMNERYDREEDASYLNSAKRDRISQSTLSQSTGGGKVYSQDTDGVEGFISTSGTLEPTTDAEIPSSKAVADYVADYAPIPLPISKGGTGGNTPYVTDDLDNSAVFVMHDASNDRYDAAPMSSLTGYLDTQYLPVNSILIPQNSDLNEFKTSGKYAVRDNSVVPSIINTPVNLTDAFYIYVFPVLTNEHYMGQQLTTYDGTATYYRYYGRGTDKWSAWTLLYPTNASTIRPEITSAFHYRTADAVAHNDLLPTNALMMDYVDGSLINYNSITVSGSGTSNLVYNSVRLKNNRIYGDCDFTVNSGGDDGGVKVNIEINVTDINIPPVFTKFILSNKPMLVHKSSNTSIEGKNIYNITNGTVYIQFNIGDFNTGEFIFIVDSVFTGYNQPM